MRLRQNFLITAANLSVGTSLLVGLGWPVAASATSLESHRSTATTTAVASDTETTDSAENTTSTTKKPTSAQTKQLQTIIQQGDKEIAQRLSSLDKQKSRISSMTKLSSASKAALLSQIDTAETGLTTLKATLDSATTVDAAQAARRNIVTEFRVYLLAIPKTGVIKVADNQLAKEAKLATFASLLKTKIDAAPASSQADLTAKLTTMTTDIAKAQQISQSVETAALGSQPSDYNANHKLLAGYEKQLQQAQQLNVSAYKTGLSISQALQSKTSN